MATPRTDIRRSAAISPEALGFTAMQAAGLVARTRAVDAVGLEERAASLAKRSIKRDSKIWALDLAIRCMDLTTLEGADTAGKVRYAEVFEICEYGRMPSRAELRKLFPFFPSR